MVQKKLERGPKLAVHSRRGMQSANSLSQHSFMWSGHFSHITTIIYTQLYRQSSIIKEQGSSLQTDTGIIIRNRLKLQTMKFIIMSPRPALVLQAYYVQTEKAATDLISWLPFSVRRSVKSHPLRGPLAVLLDDARRHRTAQLRCRARAEARFPAPARLR